MYVFNRQYRRLSISQIGVRRANYFPSESVSGINEPDAVVRHAPHVHLDLRGRRKWQIRQRHDEKFAEPLREIAGAHQVPG